MIRGMMSVQKRAGINAVQRIEGSCPMLHARRSPKTLRTQLKIEEYPLWVNSNRVLECMSSASHSAILLTKSHPRELKAPTGKGTSLLSPDTPPSYIQDTHWPIVPHSTTLPPARAPESEGLTPAESDKSGGSRLSSSPFSQDNVIQRREIPCWSPRVRSHQPTSHVDRIHFPFFCYS
jgi:hypothetical protein